MLWMLATINSAETRWRINSNTHLPRSRHINLAFACFLHSWWQTITQAQLVQGHKQLVTCGLCLLLYHSLIGPIIEGRLSTDRHTCVHLMPSDILHHTNTGMIPRYFDTSVDTFQGAGIHQYLNIISHTGNEWIIVSNYMQHEYQQQILFTWVSI